MVVSIWGVILTFHRKGRKQMTVRTEGLELLDFSFQAVTFRRKSMEFFVES